MNVFEGGRRVSNTVMGVWFAMIFIVYIIALSLSANVVVINWEKALPMVVVPPIVWTGFVYVIGYIVRGFSGIKMGSDK